MGKRTRRNYDGSFKAKVVLEVLKEQKTLAQLSSEFELHATQISEWKKQVVSAMPSLFTEKKTIISEEEKEELTAPLYQQIGQLKVELDFLKKRLRKNP
jgi:transposase-like protein